MKASELKINDTIRRDGYKFTVKEIIHETISNVNLGVFSNNTIQGESVVQVSILSSGTLFRRNTIANNGSLTVVNSTTGGCELQDNTIANRGIVTISVFNGSDFSGNNINSGGIVTIGTAFNLEFVENNIYNEANVQIPNYVGAVRQFQRCEISSYILCDFQSLPNDFIGKKCGAGFSDFETTIDCNNPLQYDLATNTLTIGSLAVPVVPYQQQYGILTLRIS